jgi:fructose-1-phosphate kinase PfkB-like protein
MKITEILKANSKLYVALDNEEAELLKELRNKDLILKSDLSERQQLIANQLVNKDLLLRINDNNRIIYKQPTRADHNRSSTG